MRGEPWIDKIMAPLAFSGDGNLRNLPSGVYNRIYEAVGRGNERQGDMLVKAITKALSAAHEEAEAQNKLLSRLSSHVGILAAGWGAEDRKVVLEQLRLIWRTTYELCGYDPDEDQWGPPGAVFATLEATLDRERELAGALRELLHEGGYECPPDDGMYAFCTKDAFAALKRHDEFTGGLPGEPGDV